MSTGSYHVYNTSDHYKNSSSGSVSVISNQVSNGVNVSRNKSIVGNLHVSSHTLNKVNVAKVTLEHYYDNLILQCRERQIR